MIKNIFNTFFLRIFNAVVNLLIAVIIARFLGAEVKGEQGLLLTTISLLSVVMNIVGLGAIVYLIPRFAYTQLIIPTYFWIFLIAFVSYFVLPFVQPGADHFYLHICILTIILTVFNLNVGSLIAKEKIITANGILFLQILIMIASLLVFIFHLKINTVYAYLYSLYSSYAISLVVSYFPISKEFKLDKSSITIETLKEGFFSLFKYGFFNQLDVFAQMLSFRFSYYILSNNAGNKEVGIYSIAVSIAESLWLISRSISSVHNARVVNTADFETNVSLTLQFIKAASLLTFFGLLLLIALPSSFYSFIFGDEFYSVKNVIISISPGIIFFSASFMISGLFAGIGKQYINSIASVVGLIITIVGAYLLIPLYGIYGAGLTASFSYTSTTIVKIIYFKTQTKVKYKDLLLSKTDIKRYVYEIEALWGRVVLRKK